jgi:hypothetical protein
MTVQELIEALSKFDPNTPVVVRGYEGGYNDIQSIQPLSIQLNVNNTWYYGAHSTNDGQPEPLPDIPMTSVVYLHGDNHLAEHT